MNEYNVSNAREVELFIVTESSGSSSGTIATTVGSNTTGDELGGGGVDGGHGGILGLGKGAPGDEVRTIPVVNQPIQALVLIVILLLAMITNGSVILNISRDSLKLRMVHFLLIRHVCITDSVGALMVLPVPLISFIKGYWDWGQTACSVISTTTACCWTMHLVAVALYRADRVFAVWLPTGKYPVLSPRIVNVLLVLVWGTALTGSYMATYAFTPTFQPALALCIPNVPLIFFILVFSCYCVGLITLTTGYVYAFIRRRRKKRKRAGGASAHNHSNVPCESHNEQTKQIMMPPRTTTDCCNNNRLVVMVLENEQDCSANLEHCKAPRAVVFNEHESHEHSSDTPSSNGHVAMGACSRPLTPPFMSARRVHHQRYTHRRVHSDDPCIHHHVVSTTSSRDSVVSSVQYRALGGACGVGKKGESSDECVDEIEDERYDRAEESVAERLDECDVSGVVSSSNANSGGVEGEEPREGEEKREGGPNELVRNRTRNPRCRVFASYAVSIGHLILYLPAMLVVGVLGGNLPPGVAFICGVVVYCEFIVQPIALLLVSPKLRNEVVEQVKSVFCCTRRNRGSETGTERENDGSVKREHENVVMANENEESTSSGVACRTPSIQRDNNCNEDN